MDLQILNILGAHPDLEGEHNQVDLTHGVAQQSASDTYDGIKNSEAPALAHTIDILESILHKRENGEHTSLSWRMQDELETEVWGYTKVRNILAQTPDKIKSVIEFLKSCRTELDNGISTEWCKLTDTDCPNAERINSYIPSRITYYSCSEVGIVGSSEREGSLSTDGIEKEILACGECPRGKVDNEFVIR